MSPPAEQVKLYIERCTAISSSDKNDFNASAISVLYPADVDYIPVFIPIVDDEIDEAMKQFFIVLLEAQQAVNSDLITISRNNSTCVIFDNEGELIFIITMINAIRFGVRFSFFPRRSNWVFTSYLHHE